VGGKTTKSDSCANATEEVNKKLNNTKLNSCFMIKHRRFQDRDYGTMAKVELNMNGVKVAIYWPQQYLRQIAKSLDL
jgi:hypothetical protein